MEICNAINKLDYASKCRPSTSGVIFIGSCALPRIFVTDKSCKENIEGRTCDRCVAGHWQFPYCANCECDLRGTTMEVCNQVNEIFTANFSVGLI